MTGLGYVTADEMTMHIYTGIREGATTVIANESPQAMHLLMEMARTIGDCLDADALAKVPAFNGTVAAILGTSRMARLESAQGYWRWMRRTGRTAPCHACDLNDGGYCDITIDWHNVSATGTVCESCCSALGLDGDDDD